MSLPDKANVYDELFSDEFGVSWVIKGERTEEDAKRAVAEIEGTDVDELEARVVRGRIGLKDGEPWFWLDKDGDMEMWEVEYL